MDSSGGLLRIEKLDESNFHVWKQKVEFVLDLKELSGHIGDSVRVPTDPDEAVQKWSKDDAKARAVIGLTLSNDHLEHVQGCKTAALMWSTITDLFQRKTLLNKLTTRRKFYSAKMATNEKAIAFISRVRQLASDCKAMDVDIDDKEIAMTVLCGLPDKYEHLIVAIDAVATDENLTLDFVKSRLLQEEQRMLERGDVKASSDAALVHNSGKSRRLSCVHCGRPGHPSEKCWKKFPHLRPNNNQAKESGLAAKSEHAAVTIDESSDDVVCLMARTDESCSLASKADWVVDSGATSHICNDRHMFSELTVIKPFMIRLGDESSVKGIGRGSVRVMLSVNGKPRKCDIKNVVYAPSMAFNIVSVRVMGRSGMRSVFDENTCHIEKGGNILAQGEISDGLYCLKTSRSHDSSEPEIALVADINVWHQRLAHVHVDGIRGMVRDDVVEGIKLNATKNVSRCKACVYGKSTRAPIPRQGGVRAKGVLDLVHTDVCGQMPEASLGGSRYFVSFVDDHSRYAWIYPIQMKSDVFVTFKKWLAMVEKSHSRSLKVLQSDNGGEYLPNVMKEFLEDRGIRHRPTTPENPHQNGVAERMNRTLVELVRSMLHHKELPKSLWAEALSVATHVRNRVTTRGLSSKTTPYEILFGRKPNLSYLRVFGCRCWYNVRKPGVDKLDRRAREAIMVGYARGSRGYKLWDAADSKMVTSRDVRFDENGEYDSDEKESEVSVPLGNAPQGHQEVTENPADQADESDGGSPNVEDDPPGESEDIVHTPDMQDESDESNGGSSDGSYGGDGLDPTLAGAADTGESRYPRRKRKRPGWWWAATALMAKALREDPKSYAEAVSGPDGSGWLVSMKLEHDSLMENQCWELVPRPAKSNVVRSKWVFKTKEEQTMSGSLGIRQKSRVVACGYCQIKGIDYSETYAPVVKLTSIRVVLSVTVSLELHLHQMDVVTAFLNGELKEEIFMEQPPGFARGDPAKVVCRLLKAIYGLKQAPRQWYAKIDEFFVHTLGMDRNPADDCVYVRRQGGNILIIALYVDDLLIACSELTVLKDTKRELSSRFKMKDLGESRIILGMDIVRDRPKRTLSLSQGRYARKVVDRFGLGSARGQRTPMDPALDLTQDSPPTYEPYREAIGCLMYLMVGTRPDLAYCIGVLAKHVQTPTQLQWDAVKRVLRYVIHTMDLGLVYGGTETLEATTVYVDADWAGDIETRKSMSGFAALMSGSLVAWCARPQEVVAMSSAESEYISLSNGVKETLWLRRLLRGLHVVPNMDKPTTVFVDNQAAMDLAHNSGVNRRNKHIDVRYHLSRQAIQDGDVSLTYCPTEEMIADMFTKPLGRVKLEFFVKAAGLGKAESAQTQ